VGLESVEKGEMVAKIYCIARKEKGCQRVTTEKMWQEAKEFYESSYKVRFYQRPSELEVARLYKDMNKLKETLASHYSKLPLAQYRDIMKRKFGRDV
jgi:hypothetical protein